MIWSVTDLFTRVDQADMVYDVTMMILTSRPRTVRIGMFCITILHRNIQTIDKLRGALNQCQFIRLNLNCSIYINKMCILLLTEVCEI